jgi:lipoic acid synthetase
MTLEILAGDFKGSTELVDIVLEADPDVFAHNLETVPRLSRQVRVQASYPRSYKVLEHARARNAVTKTGLMLGLGESTAEVHEVIRELAGLGLDILTLGQYLAPSKQHLQIDRYVHPSEFADLEAFARDAGITHVVSGPLVRSSYHADGQAELVRQLRRER